MIPQRKTRQAAHPMATCPSFLTDRIGVLKEGCIPSTSASPHLSCSYTDTATQFLLANHRYTEMLCAIS